MAKLCHLRFCLKRQFHSFKLIAITHLMPNCNTENNISRQKKRSSLSMPSGKVSLCNQPEKDCQRSTRVHVTKSTYGKQFDEYHPFYIINQHRIKEKNPSVHETYLHFVAQSLTVPSRNHCSGHCANCRMKVIIHNKLTPYTQIVYQNLLHRFAY